MVSYTQGETLVSGVSVTARVCGDEKVSADMKSALFKLTKEETGQDDWEEFDLS